MWQDIKNSRELAFALAKRDIKARYRQSFLGYVWALLPVLGTTGVFLFLRSGGALSDWDHPIAYPVYLVIGSILWQVFADAVQGPLRGIIASRSMLVKINFPRESLVIAAMLLTWFNFGVRLVILIPALIYFGMKGQVDFSFTAIFAFPIGVACLVLLGYTIGVILTPIGLLYRDVPMAVSMILNFCMFLSPVVVQIPDKGPLSKIMIWNPVTPMIDTTRSWLVGMDATLLTNFCFVAAFAFLLLIFGWILLRIALPHIIARLGM